MHMHLELADLALATRADGSSSALAPRDAVLLAWLALEGPTPRSQLAELLWPLSDPVAARNTLRQRLFHLKRHCGELVAGAAALRLADGVEHDLADAEGVLGELQFPDAPALDAWLRSQRERRVNSMRRDLERQVRALEDAGELAAALPVAQALLRLDRLSEAAHRHVMRLHYLRGDRAAALLAFDRLRAHAQGRGRNAARPARRWRCCRPSSRRFRTPGCPARPCRLRRCARRSSSAAPPN